jgi:DNA-binding MarR family transcriptional regulator
MPELDAWEVLVRLMLISHLFRHEIAAVLRPHGVGFTDFRLLLTIYLYQGASQKMLALKLGLSQVVVSTRLDRLERWGWISRSHVGRRLVAVMLTERGMQHVGALVEAVQGSALIDALRRMGHADRDRLRRSLHLLMLTLDQVDERERTASGHCSHAFPSVLHKQDEPKRTEDELSTLVRAYIEVMRRRSPNHQ